MTNTVQPIFLRSLAGAVVAGAFALTAGVASAASCSISGVGYDLNQNVGTPSLLNGVGCYVGNDKQAGSQVRDDGWTLGYSTDDGYKGGPVAGLTLTGTAASGWGSWSLTSTTYDKLLLVMKQSNTYAGFLLDLADLPTLGGAWTITGRGASHNVYSHFSVWYQKGDTPPPVSTVPLPGAAPLLLGALGAFGGFAGLRRRKAMKD